MSSTHERVSQSLCPRCLSDPREIHVRLYMIVVVVSCLEFFVCFLGKLFVLCAIRCLCLSTLSTLSLMSVSCAVRGGCVCARSPPGLQYRPTPPRWGGRCVRTPCGV